VLCVRLQQGEVHAHDVIRVCVLGGGVTQQGPALVEQRVQCGVLPFGAPIGGGAATKFINEKERLVSRSTE
jgi:hypothetical protein